MTTNKQSNTTIWLSLSLLSFAIFLSMAIGVARNAPWLHQFDQSITQLIRDPITNSKSAYFISITTLGNTTSIIGVALIFIIGWAIYKKSISYPSWLVLNLAIGSGLLNFTVKQIFRRPRPTIKHLVEQGGFSFPSGHSMGSMILFSSIAFLLIISIRRTSIKWIIALIAAFLILSVGISRIYVGVHFPSDVLGGFALGFAWIAFAIAYFDKWINYVTTKLKLK
ncbi:phosphatase PAP2 family protein [Carnobacterium divergens]|nr:phosphatase PAP2 family protein [Carnobacterium divergens]MDO0876039.1 phosphatase PAP2 family protein [Carnobacterium divergens]SUX21549.1 Undecaprenyl-diphosphatase BcrC [Carnobacterium divergens]